MSAMEKAGMEWDDIKVQFVLDKYDAGLTVQQIKQFFESAEIPVARLTIEQTLRANGRDVDGFNPLARPAIVSNTYGPPRDQGPVHDQPGHLVTHQHLVRHDNYPYTYYAQGKQGPQPSVPEVRFKPQHSRDGRLWDDEATTFTLEAFRSGKSVLGIWQELRGMGYGVNAAQVAGCLNAGGVKGVHVVDYLT
ncbi:hypothetical protein MMC31_004306 [Peltigera leucophlebia]|nr:hypothetical protein [Peltigera leucophlebia]